MTPPGTLIWTHSDSRGLDEAVDEATLRARRGEWNHGDGSRADARALLFGALAAAGGLSERSPVIAQEGRAVTYYPSVRSERSDGGADYQAALQSQEQR